MKRLDSTHLVNALIHNCSWQLAPLFWIISGDNGLAAVASRIAGNCYPPYAYDAYRPIYVGASDANDYARLVCEYCVSCELDLVAPGHNDKEAAALVTGVCSLMAALRPDLQQEQARLLLCWGADTQLAWTNNLLVPEVRYRYGR